MRIFFITSFLILLASSCGEGTTGHDGAEAPVRSEEGDSNKETKTTEQAKEINRKRYSDVEKDLEECIDEWLEENDLKWKNLESLFLGYFSSIGVTQKNTPKYKQYDNVIKYLTKPRGTLPKFKNRKEVVEIIEKIGLTEEEASKNEHLNCWIKMYNEEENRFNSSSAAFQVAKPLAKKIDYEPFMRFDSYSMMFHFDKEEFKKPLYQKSIVLVYIFDMGFHLDEALN